MAMLLLFLPLAYEVWIEAYARIIHEHMAIYFTDVHIRDLAGENIVDSGFEMPRNANVLSEMVQRTHWKDTNGGIGTCQDAGHGAHGAVASARHHQMTVLAQGAGGQRGDIIAFAGDKPTWREQFRPRPVCYDFRTWTNVLKLKISLCWRSPENGNW